MSLYRKHWQYTVKKYHTVSMGHYHGDNGSVQWTNGLNVVKYSDTIHNNHLDPHLRESNMQKVGSPLRLIFLFIIIL